MGLLEIKNGAIEALESADRTVNINLLSNAKTIEDVDGIGELLDLAAVKYSATDFKIDPRTSSLEKGSQYKSIITYVKSLTPLSFEKLSAKLVQLLGYKNSFTTKSSHDQGIDVIGTRECGYFMTNRVELIVGQCKNYKNGDVKVNEVRELAGALLLLRHREFSNSVANYTQFPVKSFSSVTGVFFSSYYFTAGSIELCQKSDIIAFTILDTVFLINKGFKDGIFEIGTKSGEIDEKKLVRLHKDIKVCA